MAATLEERGQIQALAVAGVPDAVRFMEGTPKFMQLGNRRTTAWRILIANGDEEARVRYTHDRHIRNEGQKKRVAKRAVNSSRRTRGKRKVAPIADPGILQDSADDEEPLPLATVKTGISVSDMHDMETAEQTQCSSGAASPLGTTPSMHDLARSTEGTSSPTNRSEEFHDILPTTPRHQQVSKTGPGERQSAITALAGSQTAHDLVDTREDIRTPMATSHQSETRQIHLEGQDAEIIELSDSESTNVSPRNANTHRRKGRATARQTENAVVKIEQHAEVVVIDDAEANEHHSCRNEVDFAMLECEWRLAKSKARSMKAVTELEKIRLDRILGLNHSSANNVKTEPDVKYQPDVLDNRHESELKLELITLELQYWEKKVELADFHLSYAFRGMWFPGDSDELQELTVQITKAWCDAEIAFMNLVKAFPEYRAMERPVDPSNERHHSIGF